MQKQYALWKYLVLAGITVWALIFSLPNLYGEDPAVQISSKVGHSLTQEVTENIKQKLADEKLPVLSVTTEDDNTLIRFRDTTTQIKARDLIKEQLGHDYTVALNLASKTPHWLQTLGASPIKLGLDLRGGVHFLLNVDVDTVLKAREDGDMRAIGSALRNAKVRYRSISRIQPSGISLTLNDETSLNEAQKLLTQQFHDYVFHTFTGGGKWVIQGTMPLAALTKITDYTIDQAMSILRNRVNELGVSEAVVQRQGKNHISVDLPGIQDTARAKDLIGKTATLRFQLADTEHDLSAALTGNMPTNSSVYYDEQKRPVLLKNDIILTGSSITYAIALFREGRAAVNIHLGGGGESLFHHITAENIGQPLAVVYTEIKPEQKIIDGKTITLHKKHERVISVATIQSALGNNFDITGLQNMKYAQNLALLLRSGALAAPVDIIEELTIGPSLGKANIDKGVRSLLIGSLIVILFMAIYYRLFGLVADLALMLNIVFIIAILSLLGATLTLPGIAGIVLTVGMAVDANVLINERIREELRNGMSTLASIQAGYEKAFSTIVDANVTTLIVAVVLFSLGSGSVKGFAITLIIGLLASMITSIFFTRAVINLIYSGKGKIPKKLSIGANL